MMMNRELQQHEPKFHDLDLPGACLGCGGPIAARFTPGNAVGVCRACFRISAMNVTRTDDGVSVAQSAGGDA
jgi:hypothetical protein